MTGRRGNLYLTGFMGCGKSTVARGFQALYDRPVLEMDQILSGQEGMSIPEIFRLKGETYFRERETAFLDTMEERSGTVVSCGGGVPLRKENVERMRHTGWIILLQASPEVILERVSRNDSRPLLQGKKTLEDIRALMESRRPAYESAADIVIDTDGKSVQQICREILDQIAGKGELPDDFRTDSEQIFAGQKLPD